MNRYKLASVTLPLLALQLTTSHSSTAKADQAALADTKTANNPTKCATYPTSLVASIDLDRQDAELAAIGATKVNASVESTPPPAVE